MRVTVTKTIAGILLGCAMLVGPAWVHAGEVVITYKDGTQIRGERVSEDSDTIVISIATIKTPISKKNIQQIKDILSVDEEYKQRKSALKPQDYENWYNLCYWLYKQKAYDKANTEINAFLTTHKKVSDQNNPINGYVDRANILRGLVNTELEKIKAEATATKPGTTPPAPGDAKPTTTTSTTNALAVQQQYKEQRLTDAQINMIRVWEVSNPVQSKPRVTVKKEAIEALISNYRDKSQVLKDKKDFDRLRSADGWYQLAVMFEVKARELYPSATIHDDPEALLAFKRLHTTYVLNYCGTANCHGGAEAGNLFLFNLEPASNRTVYTNYFNLYTWTDPSGFMINLDNPSESYLIQYGQPNDTRNANFVAKKPHPAVKGWIPKIKTQDDAVQRSLVEWIKSLGGFRYDYGISYNPPVVSPGAKPAMRTFSPVAAPTAPPDTTPKKATPR